MTIKWRETGRNEMEMNISNQMRGNAMIQLNELDQNVMKWGVKEREEVKKGSQGIWKRMVRGERKQEVQNNEQIKENVRGNGMKRIRLKGEEEREQQTKEVIDN